MISSTSALILSTVASLASAAPLTTRAPWQPSVGSTWQIVLSKQLAISPQSPSVAPDVSIYDIDMFAHQHTSVITSLHQLNKKVICYFSAGTSEDWRPDYSQFPSSAKGNALPDWPGENWLNTNDQTVRTIMTNRIKLASQMGCDAIDPDNIDAYDNDNGLNLTPDDAKNYIKFLSTTAASYGMSIGLKNSMDILPDVAGDVAFAVNEECAAQDECDLYADFVMSKPVFHIEYYDDNEDWACGDVATLQGMSDIISYLDLDGRVTLCPGGQSYTTATA